MTLNPATQPRLIPTCLQAVGGATDIRVADLIKRHELDIPSCRRVAWARSMVVGMLREVRVPAKDIAATLQMSASGTHHAARRHDLLMKTERPYAERYKAASRSWVALMREGKGKQARP